MVQQHHHYLHFQLFVKQPQQGGEVNLKGRINTANGSYFITIDVTGLNTFNYNKSYWNGSGMGTATAETFNYVAYWL